MTSRVLFVVLAGMSGCECSDESFPADAPPPDQPLQGTFSAQWTITDQAGQTIACDRVGAQTVSVRLTNQATATEPPEAFTCATGMATSRPLDPGIYNMGFELVGAGASKIAMAADQTSVAIEGGKDTALQPVTFAVNATGAMNLTLDTNVAGGNCGAGAGINAMTIKLFHNPGGTCEPVTFAINPGGGTYTVNCDAPAVSACIENNQTLSVPVMPSGGYKIQIRAQVNGVDCFVNDDALLVPPLGGTLTTKLNLGKTC